MSRLNADQLRAAAIEKLGASVDESGQADLIFDKGSLLVAGEAGELKAVFKRAKKIDGYRWVMINQADLFAANPLSLGSKAGLITPEGKVLKNADVPRKKI